MSIKKNLTFSNALMLIVPILVALLTFELSTNYFENIFVLRNENYPKYIEKSSLIVDYAKSQYEFKLAELESYANQCGFSIYINKDGNLYYENLERRDEDIVSYIKVIEHDVVYQLNGKMTISTQVLYDDGYYEMYFVSKENISPLISISFVQMLLLSVLFISFITVALTNFITTNRLVKSILNPLDTLAKSADKIRLGNLSEPVGNSGVKELQELFYTFDLMREELKQSTEENEQHEKNRREMIAGISHDLKTPLTVIQGYSKGLLDGVASNPAKTKKYIEIINKKSIEMESLLNQLTVFSKLDNKTFEFKKELRNIDFLLNKYIKLQRTQFYDKKVYFEYVNKCKHINVSIDVLQVQRVLDNLISNSIKYNDKDKVIIKFYVYVLNINEVAIEVSDNGIGVLEKDLGKIFESFYRVDQSRSTKIEGSGLGLAICKSIIEAHNGKISAISKDGLTIRITLPIGEQDE